MKKYRSVLKLCVIFALTLMIIIGSSPVAAAQSAIVEEDYNAEDAGSFYLYTTDKNGNETLYGELFYDRNVSTKTIELAGSIQSVRLVKASGYEVNIDELTLNGTAPAGYERKLSATDCDLIELEDEATFELCGSGTLVISARAPISVGSPEDCVRFPEANMGADVTADSECYTYVMDSKIATLTDAATVPSEDLLFNSVMVYPSSGHPDAPIDYYVANDADYLYIYAEVFGDNTFDHGKDHSGIYILCGDEVKYFAVYTTDENEYGSWAFQYTDSDADYNYEHMQYLVKIPRSEIADAGDTVSMVFEYYGTLVSYPGSYVYSFKKVDGQGNPVEGAEFSILITDAAGSMLFADSAVSDAEGNVVFDKFSVRNFMAEADKTLLTPAELQALWEADMNEKLGTPWTLEFNPTEGYVYSGEFKMWDWDTPKSDMGPNDANYYFKFTVTDGVVKISDITAQGYGNTYGHDDGSNYVKNYVYNESLGKWFWSVRYWSYLFEQVCADTSVAVVTETDAPVGYKSIGKVDGLTFAYDENWQYWGTVTYLEATTDVVNEIETIDIPVTKIWNDSNNQDEIRPPECTLALYADGEDTGKSITLDANSADTDGNWAGAFTSLPKYANGVAIEYSIKEPDISGYTSDITGSFAEGFTVTNTHKSVGSLTVSKVVKGSGSSGKSFSFTVTLGNTSISGVYGDMTFENGVATFTLTGGRSMTATGLPHGISYTVTEENPTGYVTTKTNDTGSISGNNVIEAKFINSTSPATGDDHNVALWLIVCGLSLSGITAATVTGRKKAKR